MIQETELNLLVPSPELLIRLASGDRPLGVSAGAPHIRTIRETYFDTPDQTLRRRGMTCKLRQEESGATSVVVTVGEGPDSEGITSRSRLSASAVGVGFYETLKGQSEAAIQIQGLVRPQELRPTIALDIQRLARVHRRGLLRRPTLTLNFDRITVQVGGRSTVFHELRIRRTLRGGPLIRDLAQQLRDEHHLFADGLSTLQRAYRIHMVEERSGGPGLSPYTISLGLALFQDGKLGLLERGGVLGLPTFRGSGEDATRALCADVTGRADLPLTRLGSTEPREGREALEIWAAPDPGEDTGKKAAMTWLPWHELLDRVGTPALRHSTLLSALLLLTRKRLLGQLPWIPGPEPEEALPPRATPSDPTGTPDPGDLPDQLRALDGIRVLVGRLENPSEALSDRLLAASEISTALTGLFEREVRDAKERILCREEEEADEAQLKLLDLLVIRIRSVVDRLYRCLEEDLLPGLDAAGIHLRSWSGIPHEDRRAFLALFREEHLPEASHTREWGPAFRPDITPEGCAIGMLAPAPGGEGTRFFHIVLDPETPSFLSLPNSPVVLPLEEVVRGHLYSEHPELERTDTFLFRFMTGEVRARERIPTPSPAKQRDAPAREASQEGVEEPGDGSAAPESGSEPAVPLLTMFRETREIVITRVMVRQKTPESLQAQLLRALERQVTRRDSLVGLSDLYPVRGPLDLTGIHRLLEILPDR